MAHAHDHHDHDHGHDHGHSHGHAHGGHHHGPVDTGAEQTVLSLDSVAGSVINNDFLSRADIDPKSALAQDDPEAEGVLRLAAITAPKARTPSKATFFSIFSCCMDRAP